MPRQIKPDGERFYEISLCAEPVQDIICIFAWEEVITTKAVKIQRYGEK